MLSKDLFNLAESFTALAEDTEHTVVIGPAQAENFARVLLDYARQAAALEGQPVPTAKVLRFPYKFPQGAAKPDTSPTPGGAA